jgi:drug/metabolite transporter (DMT)-like permease
MLWGMIAALGWGTADFLARGASVQIGAYRALLYAQGVSGSCLALVIAWDAAVNDSSVGLLGLAALLGGLNTAGILLLYRALAVGPIAIVSPVGSSFAAVTLGLSILTGDPIAPGKMAGLLLMVVGVLLAASAPAVADGAGAARHQAHGVPEALGAALALGIMFWGLKYVVPGLGPWVPVLAGRAMALILLPAFARPLRQSIALPPRATWPGLLAIGLLDTGANVGYNVGLQSEAPGVVAVLGSLFSPITVLLAYVFLHERLAPRQWLGVGLIFIAITAMGIAEHRGGHSEQSTSEQILVANGLARRRTVDFMRPTVIEACACGPCTPSRS